MNCFRYGEYIINLDNVLFIKLREDRNELAFFQSQERKCIPIKFKNKDEYEEYLEQVADITGTDDYDDYEDDSYSNSHDDDSYSDSHDDGQD